MNGFQKILWFIVSCQQILNSLDGIACRNQHHADVVAPAGRSEESMDAGAAIGRLPDCPGRSVLDMILDGRTGPPQAHGGHVQGVGEIHDPRVPAQQGVALFQQGEKFGKGEIAAHIGRLFGHIAETVQ